MHCFIIESNMLIFDHTAISLLLSKFFEIHLIVSRDGPCTPYTVNSKTTQLWVRVTGNLGQIWLCGFTVTFFYIV